MRAGVDSLLDLQGEKPLHIGGIHQRSSEIAMIGISRRVDGDGAVEMFKSLRVFSGAPHDAAARRLDVAEGQIMIGIFESGLGVRKQAQSLLFSGPSGIEARPHGFE